MLIEYVKLEKLKDDSSSEKWRVKGEKFENLGSSGDIVIICVGHYLFDPYIPEIPGLSNFQGLVMHSHDYREPDAFSEKVVIVLGASNSGINIALDLSEQAMHIYLSHNKDRITQEVEENIIQVQGVNQFENGEFVLKDTGYNYNYSFLDENCGIRVNDNHVTPLYQHMINIEHPTMCFIGNPADETQTLAVSSQMEGISE